MKIKFLSEGAQMPTKADSGAAGYDLYVPKDTRLFPGRNIIPLDFAIQLEHGYEATIRPRSGFSAKGFECMTIHDDSTVRINADVLLGTIDETYRGNVGVIVKSNEPEEYIIPKGSRIAQMVISQCYMGKLERSEELSETERGEQGFGHSGVK
jgi:dUTP pyrophosphatase|nr:MAG TPA: deoxyuridine 5'-triphosphate nucleotidohydrolase [Caudoviricetes sp.]